jgi:hypothetical protein
VADPHTRAKLQWLDAIAEDRQIPHLAFRLAYVIASKYLNRNSGEAWPSHQTLANDLDVNEKTVRLNIAVLAKANRLRVTSGRGRGNTNIYEIISVNRAAHSGFMSGKRVGEPPFSGWENRASRDPQTGEVAPKRRANGAEKAGA